LTLRRSFSEWLFISAAGFFLATVALFGFSSHPLWSAVPLDLAPRGWSANAYVLIRNGRASFCNAIDYDEPGSLKPLVINPPGMIFPKMTENHQFSMPGLAFQFCRFSTGRWIWSLEFSLVIPAVLSLFAAVLLIRRLMRCSRRDALVRAESS
jgi:hypothetical protein